MTHSFTVLPARAARRRALASRVTVLRVALSTKHHVVLKVTRRSAVLRRFRDREGALLSACAAGQRALVPRGPRSRAGDYFFRPAWWQGNGCGGCGWVRVAVAAVEIERVTVKVKQVVAVKRHPVVTVRVTHVKLETGAVDTSTVRARKCRTIAVVEVERITVEVEVEPGVTCAVAVA